MALAPCPDRGVLKGRKAGQRWGGGTEPASSESNLVADSSLAVVFQHLPDRLTLIVLSALLKQSINNNVW